MIKHVNLDLFEISRYQKTTKAISLDKDDELVRAIISEGHISLITINKYTKFLGINSIMVICKRR